METKQIYEKYIEEFTDEVKDYIKATKCEDINQCHHWEELLEITEQFRIDMLSKEQELPNLQSWNAGFEKGKEESTNKTHELLKSLLLDNCSEQEFLSWLSGYLDYDRTEHKMPIDIAKERLKNIKETYIEIKQEVARHSSQAI